MTEPAPPAEGRVFAMGEWRLVDMWARRHGVAPSRVVHVRREDRLRGYAPGSITLYALPWRSPSPYDRAAIAALCNHRGFEIVDVDP